MAPIMFQSIAQNQQHPPPTPPRETVEHRIDHALQLLDTSVLNLDSSVASRAYAKLSSDADFNTPPPSSPLDKASSRSRPTRRIRFLPEPIPRPDNSEPRLRVLPPSRDGKSRKSILKPYTPSPSCESANHDPFSSPSTTSSVNAVPRMLESIVQQLAGQDMISKYEAYQTLSTSLKAYDKSPEPEALEAKLPLLQDFIRRDLVSTASDGASPVHRLPLLALKTVQVLLLVMPTSRVFSQEFLAFLIDQATANLVAPNTSKELVLNYMHLLAQQKLYVKAMTRNRSQKLLVALSTVHERVTGNNVYRLRLMIYQRFIRQCSQAAVENLSHWLIHVFHGMLSDNSDIRARSIETALTAGSHIGEAKQISQTMTAIWSQDIGDDRKYHAHFSSRLEELLKQPDNKDHVPQIWGAVMLLMQANGKLIENWLTSKSWLRLLEDCFNTSDASLNMHAWMAWNKTIFAARSLLGTSVPVLRRLRAPITGHLQRRSSGKTTEAAFSTYSGLLYYAFAPSSSIVQRALCWKMLVQEVVTKIVDSNPLESGRLCTILSALLSRHNVTTWDVNRALRTMEEPFALDEVPRLDAHWIRTNFSLVGDVVSQVMMHSNGEEQVRVWSSLMSAVSDARSKEIKSSLESRKATAIIVTILHSLSTKTQSSLRSSGSLGTLAAAAIEAITPGEACEPVLLKSAAGVFEVAASPSRHAGKAALESTTPVIALLHMLFHLHASVDIDAPLRGAVQEIVQPCCETKSTRRAKVQFLRTCLNGICLEKPTPAQLKVQSQVWQSIVELASATLRESAEEVAQSTTVLAGPDIRDLVSILVAGLAFADMKSLRFGRDLFNALRRFTRRQAGDAAVMLEILTPLMRKIDFNSTVCCSAAALQYTGCIIDEGITMPSDRLIEQARRALWGTQVSGSTEVGPSWLSELYTLIDEVLIDSYAALDTLPGIVVQTFLRIVTTYLDSTPASQRANIQGAELFLWNTKDGVSAYLKDEANKLKIHVDRGVDLKPDVRKLWVSILGIGARLPLHPNAKLRVMEDILCAGFQSRSKNIANLTIAAWNRAFGPQDMLEYPEKLCSVLARLRHHVDIELLAFRLPETDADANTDDQATFLWLSSSNDSQQLEEAPKSSAPATVTPRKPFHLAGRSSNPASAVSTPTRSAAHSRQSVLSTPPARLRHDDSQIQFVAVESSPIALPRYDSQVLTDHQKEVKMRQRADIAIFSDIRSSPVNDTQSTNVPATAVQPTVVDEAVSTPEPTVDDEIMEEAEHITPLAEHQIEENNGVPHETGLVDKDTPTLPSDQVDHVGVADVDGDVTMTADDVTEVEDIAQPEAEDDEEASVPKLTAPQTQDPHFEQSEAELGVEENANLESTTDEMEVDETNVEAELDEPVLDSSDVAARINDAVDQELSDGDEEDVTVLQDHSPKVMTSPYVLIEQPAAGRRNYTDKSNSNAKKRIRSDMNDDCIVVKQKKPDSPSLLTLLQKSFSSQRSPNTSFSAPSGDTPARSSPRKRGAAQVELDDGTPGHLIQRAPKRRRSGRLSQNQSQSQDQEEPSQAQDSPSQSHSQSQSSQRKSSRLSGNAAALATGLSTPRHSRRRPRKLVDSTATDIRTPTHSPQKRVIEEDEDELSQDVIPDTALPPNTPGSQRSRRGSKLGEFPDGVSSSPGPSSFIENTFADERSPTKKRDPSSWDGSTVDMTIHCAGMAHAKRASQDGADTSPLMSASRNVPAVSSPTTPRATTIQAAPSPSSSVARGIIGRLYSILADCKTLVLGPSERKQREELEDVTHELQRELTRAVRRGNA